MKMKWMTWIIISLLFLTGCAVQESESTSTAMAEGDVQPQATMTKMPAITDRGTVVSSDLDGGLTVIEYPMLLKESVEEVLAAFADADWNTISSRPYEVQIGRDLITYRIGEILADQDTESIAMSQCEVTIFKNDEPMMTIPLGTTGPISPAYGIYTDGTAWYLEVDRGESFTRDDGGIEISNLGDIYRDGESLNEAEGYDESFGFTFLSGKPFYLFERNGKFGYSFDGVEYSLPYTDIWHHRCCSAGLANPRGSEGRVVIFANKGDQRYLVMIGDFE